MRKMLLLLMIPVLLLGMVGCGQKTVSGEVLQSEIPRDTAPELNETDLATLVNGNNSFAFNLYQVLKDEKSNLFYSPYSISAALAMTYAGARGDTEKAMAEALRFDLPQDRLHPAFNGLDLQLEQRGEGAKGMDGEGFRLNIVNAIWGQKDYRFLDEYLDILAQNYGAGLRIVDFINETEQSRLTINKWVIDQTEGRIEDLIPQGAIDSDTRLVLSNAIYFIATWLEPFIEELTEEDAFYGLNGDELTAEMMRHGTGQSFGYFQGEGFQAVDLPYIGAQISMLVIVPDRGEFTAFEENFHSDQFAHIVDGLEYTSVYLRFPKFEFESEISLAQTLAEMGMPSAFSGAADFSGMTGSKDLFISDVFHKAFVSVDEEGTEAAAATAVVMKMVSEPLNPVELTVDRPFIFLIREHETNSILFMGRVVEP